MSIGERAFCTYRRPIACVYMCVLCILFDKSLNNCTQQSAVWRCLFPYGSDTVVCVSIFFTRMRLTMLCVWEFHCCYFDVFCTIYCTLFFFASSLATFRSFIRFHSILSVGFYMVLCVYIVWVSNDTIQQTKIFLLFFDMYLPRQNSQYLYDRREVTIVLASSCVFLRRSLQFHCTNSCWKVEDFVFFCSYFVCTVFVFHIRCVVFNFEFAAYKPCIFSIRLWPSCFPNFSY